MAGAERLCHFLNGVASLCHIFKWGREMKKVGNHWPTVYEYLTESDVTDVWKQGSLSMWKQN